MAIAHHKFRVKNGRMCNKHALIMSSVRAIVVFNGYQNLTKNSNYQ